MTPFSRVLVANRGEIAVRVIRACRELGITTVAVYSAADAGTLHVRLADEAVALTGNTAGESYLDGAQIVAAVRASGAEAVHPGYGFLSEDAAFARAVTDAGAVFIGPPPAAIEMMGDKLSARSAAEKAGVVVVPGTTAALDDAAEVVRFGDAHGWPVAIKAAFGGGGRGIRLVGSAAEAGDAFASAASEAEQGFGHAECYVERYLAWPRHIEMQIFADAHGNCVWLGERECSIQRRHQKLIEEAPAPAFADEARRAMGEAAVRVAKVAGYVGAGTVEFLVEGGDFWFLEMNTRLQVEHPVTEMITGLDLVAEQIRVAAGAPLGFTQESVERRGHAIECRLNAEDPAGGRFVPSPGTVTELAPPQGFGVRWDGGYEAGDTVSPFYDNLIGKLVVWAADRPAAIARMAAALAEMRLEGLPTTIPAHQVILAHPDFVAARHSTVWVEQALALPEAAPAAVGSAMGDGAAPGRSQEVRVAGRWYAIPRPGEETRPPAGRRLGPPASGGQGSGTVTSEMQGTVVRVLVAVGDSVEAGQGVCAVEAMKMETVLRSGIAGTVAEIRAGAGQAVRAGEVLVVVEPA